jgi:hypothetical protein
LHPKCGCPANAWHPFRITPWTSLQTCPAARW